MTRSLILDDLKGLYFLNGFKGRLSEMLIFFNGGYEFRVYGVGDGFFYGQV